MDLREVRSDLATVAAAAGFNAWDFVPDDPQDLPAAVVGGINSMERVNRIKTQIQLPVSFYVSESDAHDATASLDLVCSVDVDGSFIDKLDAAVSTSWDTARFVSAGPYERVDMPGNGTALAVQVVLELIA